MIQRVRDDMGSEADAGWDAKVVGSISNGLVKDIHVSSPQLEGSLQQSIQDGVNDMVKGAGVNLAGKRAGGGITSYNVNTVSFVVSCHDFIHHRYSVRLPER